MEYKLSEYKEIKPHYIKRLLWSFVNATLFRIILGGSQLRGLRNVILRAFGARLPNSAVVYPSSKIYAPWNLVLGESSCIGPHTEIYNKAPVVIGDNVVISQRAYLCTASHDVSDSSFALITKPIIIESGVWVAADAFVGMGVTIGEGAVVGARAAVFKDVESWTIVGGNPAREIKKRFINK